MSAREVQIPVSEIRDNDRYGSGNVGWTATADATTYRGVVTVPVIYADGGTGTRTWADETRELVVTRG